MYNGVFPLFRRRRRRAMDANRFNKLTPEQWMAFDDIRDTRNRDIKWYNFIMIGGTFAYLSLAMVVWPELTSWTTDLLTSVTILRIFHVLFSAHADSLTASYFLKILSFFSGIVMILYLLIVLVHGLLQCKAMACVNQHTRFPFIFLYLLNIVMTAFDFVIFLGWAPILINSYAVYNGDEVPHMKEPNPEVEMYPTSSNHVQRIDNVKTNSNSVY